MSDLQAPPELDLREELARIDRNRAETQKLLAETQKLFSEARKFNRDPWFLVIGAIVAGAVTRLPEILRAFGVGG